jgi:hypothetical protein
VPEGFTAYTSDFGWSVAYPEGWEVRPGRGSAVDFREPGTGRYLRVDATDTPAPSALENWREYSQDFAARHENYRELRLEPVEFGDFEEAVDWEYTYSEGGANLHAINRNLVTQGRDTAYALNFQTRAPDWEASRGLFDQMAETFRPRSQG